jgi:hypothetical protein
MYVQRERVGRSFSFLLLFYYELDFLFLACFFFLLALIKKKTLEKIDMETQVREAQFELAKQHDLQKEATARAEAAEEVVASLEEAVEAEKQQVYFQKERVGLLRNRLATRHVHVNELRHLVGCRRTTEEALTEQANQLIATLRDSIATAESLHIHNTNVAQDAEERRVQGLDFVGITSQALVTIRNRSESHLLSEEAALKLLEEASLESSASSKQSKENWTNDMLSLEDEMRVKLNIMATNVSTTVNEAAVEEDRSLASASKGSDETCQLVVKKAAEIDNSLSMILSEVSEAESSLVSWASSTCSNVSSMGDELSDRSNSNASTVQSVAKEMEDSFVSSLSVIAKDTSDMDTLLNDLSQHSAAAHQQAESASTAEQTGAESLLSARVSLDEAANTLSMMVFYFNIA